MTTAILLLLYFVVAMVIALFRASRLAKWCWPTLLRPDQYAAKMTAGPHSGCRRRAGCCCGGWGRPQPPWPRTLGRRAPQASLPVAIRQPLAEAALRAEAPGGNWLPTRKGTTYRLTFRCYRPTEGVANGTYYPPPLIKMTK